MRGLLVMVCVVVGYGGLAFGQCATCPQAGFQWSVAPPAIVCPDGACTVDVYGTPLTAARTTVQAAQAARVDEAMPLMCADGACGFSNGGHAVLAHRPVLRGIARGGRAVLRGGGAVLRGIGHVFRPRCWRGRCG